MPIGCIWDESTGVLRKNPPIDLVCVEVVTKCASSEYKASDHESIACVHNGIEIAALHNVVIPYDCDCKS